VDPSGVAYRAAEIMSEQGHCKGMLRDLQGRVCFNGALLTALNRRWFDEYSPEGLAYWAIRDTAVRLLREQGFTGDVVEFNNDPRTSGEDVICLLKAAGKELETPCTQ
jgi:hypothetical protein